MKKTSGQVLVIFAAAMLLVMAFVGISVDTSMAYYTYGNLKKSVDASVISAANAFKRGSSITVMTETAKETLALNSFGTAVQEDIYICDLDGDGLRDASLLTTAPEFYNMCPDTTLTDHFPRKLVYAKATYNSPTYFMSLFGITTVPISTYSVAEAAPIDLVIVLDVSESMGVDSPGYETDNFDPATCNASNNCQPLKQAKDAAKSLIDTLYQGYDRVAVVSFDQMALTAYNIGGDMTAAKSAIDNVVHLHDDAPRKKIWQQWLGSGRLNPVNPEDRDGDGGDYDDPAKLGYTCVLDSDRWDTTQDPYGWGGVPCDDNSQLDAYDWNGNGTFDASDATTSANWQASRDPFGSGNSPHPPMAILSTCTGCGLRESANILIASGRQNAVWVMVVLSDGLANLSDTPTTDPYNATSQLGVPADYPLGYCGGELNADFWKSNCIDKNISPRWCINSNPDTCPPGSSTTDDIANPQPPLSPPYSVYDYALDMADRAALTISTNPDEANGNDIAIYTIGLGDGGAAGEGLLRYVASVGDDGDRDSNPCSTVAAKRTCGNYYYAQTGASLLPIFEDIASRIYTKVTR
jgi:hypothetical protein